MNILIICDIPWFSGLSHYAIEVGEYFLKEGSTVYWATETDSDLWKKLEGNKFKLIPIKSRKSKHFFYNLRTLKKSLKEIDKILCFTGSSLTLGYFLKKRFKSELFRFRTEAFGVKNNFFNRLIYKRCNGVIAGNKKIRDELRTLGIEKINVIYAGVDLSDFPGMPLPDELTIGYLGRLDHVKGIEILWDAMNLIWNQFPDLKLNIAGREVNYKWSEIASRFNGPVKYWGYLNRKEVKQFIKASSFGIITSTGSEATSRVLLEWWASGRPVISTSVGIFPELIENNTNSIIINPNDSKSLTAEIIKFLENEKNIEKLGNSAREKIEKELSKEIFNKELSLIFSKKTE
ncbi:glycosyltransferase family 4 protein [Candidatus Dependentiae bacterium]|nr:glycosyltransferase family 4 protein [Candidatus Dependentiae bacterium]